MASTVPLLSSGRTPLLSKPSRTASSAAAVRPRVPAAATTGAFPPTPSRSLSEVTPGFTAPLGRVRLRTGRVMRAARPVVVSE